MFCNIFYLYVCCVYVYQVPAAELVGVHELYLRPVGHLGVVVLLEDVRPGLAAVTLSPTLRLIAQSHGYKV